MVVQAVNCTTSEGTMQIITSVAMNINPVAAKNAGEPQTVGVREGRCHSWGCRDVRPESHAGSIFLSWSSLWSLRQHKYPKFSLSLITILFLRQGKGLIYCCPQSLHQTLRFSVLLERLVTQQLRRKARKWRHHAPNLDSYPDGGRGGQHRGGVEGAEPKETFKTFGIQDHCQGFAV